MIPDYFFEDPFVYNVTVDDMVDCLVNVNQDIFSLCFLSKIKERSQDLEESHYFYSHLVNTYMRENLKNKGDFLVIHNGKTIVKACEEDGSSPTRCEVQQDNQCSSGITGVGEDT